MACTTKQADLNIFIVVFKNEPLKNANTVSKHIGNEKSKQWREKKKVQMEAAKHTNMHTKPAHIL